MNRFDAVWVLCAPRLFAYSPNAENITRTDTPKMPSVAKCHPRLLLPGSISPDFSRVQSTLVYLVFRAQNVVLGSFLSDVSMTDISQKTRIVKNCEMFNTRLLQENRLKNRSGTKRECTQS